ncbi:MAG TPA: M20 aminoacylase family protein [Burkholderiaceae bacterium]|nr:M20 aminoacylase family protein [Burkholderiaceae bacterium]
MTAYLGLKLKSPLRFIVDRHEALTLLRRDLHANPEMGFEEHRTSALIAERLHQFGVEVHPGVGRTGVVGVVRGRECNSARAVALRADMDALPLNEESDVAYRSTTPGVMHACGHDGHVAMLLGAAQYLASTRNFDGHVNLVFQPAEEGRGGARAMLDDGLFDRFPSDEIYALHNWPALPAGHIGLNTGPMMAACDRFEITIHGRGGHGAHPHLAVDPIVVSSHVVAALQTIVARNTAPLESAVVSVCAIQAGRMEAPNVIPGEARMAGTVRTFQHSVQSHIEARIAEVAAAIARGFGAEATVRYVHQYPATINHAPQAEFAARVAEDLVGTSRVARNLQPSMGSEDFSLMLQARPGCYLRLGQGSDAHKAFLHNPGYDFNDAVLPLGAALLAAIAERRLGAPAATAADESATSIAAGH